MAGQSKDEFIRKWATDLGLAIEQLDAVKCECSEECEEWIIKIKIKGVER